MNKHFYAVILRMKYINRWGLMRNTRYENLSEHSFDVAVIAHALAIIKNTYFGGDIDENRVAVLAIYHDAPEILTGDLPTPVKYYNADTKAAYDKVEETAISRFLKMLPEEMLPGYKGIFLKDDKEEYLWKLVKAADSISALIKCMEEEKSGNKEFSGAREGIEKKVYSIDLPEVQYFIEHFLPSFELTLDEHTHY